MTRPKITKLSPYRFEVSYEGEVPLRLDFEALHHAAQRLHPCREYVLKHWQARPQGLRRFGLYHWKKCDGWYSSHASPEASDCLHYDLQVDEGGGPPIAALFYPGAYALANRVRSFPSSTAVGLNPEDLRA